MATSKNAAAKAPAKAANAANAAPAPAPAKTTTTKAAAKKAAEEPVAPPTKAVAKKATEEPVAPPPTKVVAKKAPVKKQAEPVVEPPVEDVEEQDAEEQDAAPASGGATLLDQPSLNDIPEEIRGDRRAVVRYLYASLIRDLEETFEKALDAAQNLGRKEFHLDHVKSITSEKVTKTELSAIVSKLKREVRAHTKNATAMLTNASNLFRDKERRHGAIRGYKSLGDFPKESKGNTSSHFTKAQVFRPEVIAFLKGKKYGVEFERDVKAMLDKGVLSIAVFAQLMSAYAKKEGLLAAGNGPKGKYMRLTADDRQKLAPILELLGDKLEDEYIEYSVINKIAGNAVIKADELSEEQLQNLETSAHLVDKVHAAFAAKKAEKKAAEKAAKDAEKAAKDAERAEKKAAKDAEKAAAREAKAAEKAAAKAAKAE